MRRASISWDFQYGAMIVETTDVSDFLSVGRPDREVSVLR